MGKYQHRRHNKNLLMVHLIFATREHKKMLLHHYWKEKTLWSDGYFAASIGQVSQETIERYIEHQG